MTRLAAAAAVLLLSHGTTFSYSLFQYDGAETKRHGGYTYPILATISGDPRLGGG